MEKPPTDPSAGPAWRGQLFECMEEGVALHELVRGADGAVCDYRILDANPAFHRHTGLGPDSARGRLATDLYRSPSAPCLEVYSRVALGGAPTAFEAFFPTLGKHFRVSVSSPAPGQFATVFWDVTDQKAAGEEIRRLNEELERRVLEDTAKLEAANKEMEAFSYSVSHDLRAPLRSIDGFSQVILEDYQDRLDEAGRHYLSRIRHGTQRMGQLIDDLLKLSRTNRGELTRADCDLTRIAAGIAQELAAAAPGRQVQVSIQPGLKARADPRLMRVVLDNLLGNAWKFTVNTGEARIEVGGRGGDGEQVFFVKDNGAGFDMAHAGKLFTAFQRLHSAAEFEGSGIGLAIVQRIVHRHGGRVEAAAEPGLGATFTFSLPDRW